MAISTMDIKGHLKYIAVYSVWGLLMHSSSLCALELNANLYSETEYTSNARLVAFNTEDEVIERVGVNVLLREERKRFNSKINTKTRIWKSIRRYVTISNR